MTSSPGPASAAVHSIDHALTVADARDALTALTGAVDAAAGDAPLGLELTGTVATAPALQLLLAGARALVASDAFAGFGPTAAAALGALSIDIPAKGQGIAR